MTSAEFNSTYVLGALLAYIVASYAWKVVRAPRFNVPWAGKTGWLSFLQSVRERHVQGYETHGKHGKAYVVRGTFGNPPEVVVPRAEMAWMIDQPDSVLSTHAAHYDTLVGEHNFLTPLLLKDPYHERVLHRSLPRHLSTLIPGIQAELTTRMDAVLAKDKGGWQTVTVWDTLFDMIPGVTNRMLVGEPLCRDDEYLGNMKAVTNDIARNMMMLNAVPRAVRAVLGPLLCLSNSYHYRRTARRSIPVIRQRLAEDPDDETRRRCDYLSWHIAMARADGRTGELDAKRIAQRLVPLNFAANHTTSLGALNLLLDVYSCDDAVVASLREEAERVFAGGNGRWTKPGLARLHRIDSAIRESMRLSGFAQTLMQRKVVAPQGAVHADLGWHFPQGTLLSCPAWGVHHDEELFAGAEAYDAFRYSRDREAFEGLPKEERGIDEGLRLKKTGLVTTSSLHFPFGHGRHAW